MFTVEVHRLANSGLHLSAAAFLFLLTWPENDFVKPTLKSLEQQTPVARDSSLRAGAPRTYIARPIGLLGETSFTGCHVTRFEKRGHMKSQSLGLCIFLLTGALTASADTLHLKTGQTVYGTFNGRTPQGIQFTGTDGRTLIYPYQEVDNLNFGPIPAPPQPAPSQQITVPPGTIVFVRMTDTLDTDSAYTGQVFTATLATDLAAEGYVVARTGTTVYGQVLEANSAGRASGTSQLKLQLTQIVINGTAIPILTDVFDSKGKSSRRRSFRRLFGGAGLGAAIGAIAGNAGMGAAIGAVAGGALSVVQKGDQVQIPSEAQLEFHLQQPVTLPIVQ